MATSHSFPFRRSNPNRVLAVRGGIPLHGTYPISGAKNAALPLMICALLASEPVCLRNVPANLDIVVVSDLLRSLGADVDWSHTEAGLSVTISAQKLRPAAIQLELVTLMRASVSLLGAVWEDQFADARR
jgi:UDP-N-acetylglucosamine 1-carboxyvinyltransferase